MDGGASEEVTVAGVAAGGEGVGRLSDGRAVFVRGALPGERVRVTVTEERRRFARAELLEVVEAAPERVAPPCPQVEAGCGGCDWQHVAPAAQRALKARIVTDALRRIGRIPEPPEPDLGPQLPVEGWRTTVRALIDDKGRAGFRRHHAHDPLAVGDGGCLVAHPLVDEILREGVFPPPVREVTVRAGAATGERLVVCTPTVGDSRVPGTPGGGSPPAGGPPEHGTGGTDDDRGRGLPEHGTGGTDDARAGVTVVGTDELTAGHRAWIHEVVAGRRWRISADSFFQGRPDGAEALVDTVVGVLGDAVTPGASVVDLYSGVGLFAGVLGQRTGAVWWRWSPAARRWPMPASTWPTSTAPGSCGATCGAGARPPPTWWWPTRPARGSEPRSSPESEPRGHRRWRWSPATPGPWGATPACWPPAAGN